MSGVFGLPGPLLAGMWMTGAMLSFTLMAISGRSLADRLDTFEIMTYRSLIGIVVVLSVAFYAGTWQQISTKSMRLHLIRNVFHFAGQNLWFFAVIYVPLSQLFVFEFSTPLWVAICAPLILSERLTLTRFSAAAIGFLGILVVVRPDFSALPPELIAAALCAVGFAGATIATKLLTTPTPSCTSRPSPRRCAARHRMGLGDSDWDLWIMCAFLYYFCITAGPGNCCDPI